MEKYCSRCKSSKELSEFGDKKTERDGKQSWCKCCSNLYYNEWRVNNRAKSKKLEIKSFDNFYGTHHGRAVHMINNCKSRCRRKGLIFDLDVAWVEEKLKVGVCEATKIPFIFQKNGGRGHRNNSFSPSLDRIDQTGNYTKENCRITCWIYNRARGAFPPGDFELMINSMLSNSLDINN